MKRYYLLLLSVYCIVVANGADVCIVGAGPSGIQAAYSLEEAGYTTVVFEKESYIGGKTKTVTIDGIRHQMGAVLHSSRKSSSIKYLLDRFGIPEVDDTDIDNDFEFDPDDTIDEARVFSTSRPLLALLGITQYIVHRTILSWKQPNGPEFFLENDCREELHKPMSDWLRKRWIFGLEDLFWYFLTLFGYGLYTEIPAIYVLKYADAGAMMDAKLAALTSSLSFLPFVRTGLKNVFFEDLLVAMAESLNGEIYLSANITKVTYGEDSNVVEFHISDWPVQQIACNKMVLAFPQTADDTTLFIPPDIAGTLSSLTLQVQTSSYYTLLLADPEGIFKEDGIYSLEAQSSIPSNPAIIHLIKFGKVGSVVVYYLSPTKKTEDEAKLEMVSSLSEFIGRPIESIVVQDFNAWAYFPHVNKESLDECFYEKFNELQGVSNQYYVGGLFNFESVQDAMEHARFIIDEYF